MKIMSVIIVINIGIIVGGLIVFFTILGNDTNEPTKKMEFPADVTPFNIDHKGEGRKIPLGENSIFEVWTYDDEIILENNIVRYYHEYFALKPENTKLYEELGVYNDPQSTVFVVPIFTITAYGDQGFYDYYFGECDFSCITSIPIRHELPLKHETSMNSIKVLRLLGYPFITDIEIDKNPDILKSYDKVIILHSEYVTQKEFKAITQHPKVIFLYPNALYAEIKVDYDNDTITLIRGHGYPVPEISNGFDWEFDNTHPFEFDTECSDWEFYEIDNGIMLNCYPEEIIFQDKQLLKMIKDY